MTIAPRKTRRGLAQHMRSLTGAPLALVAAPLLLGPLSCGDGTTEPAPPTPPAPVPTTVTVSPETARLAALGATTQLSAAVRDQNGQAMAGAAVTWASNAAAVATVNGSGLVTAVGNGTATITATAGAASGSATVTVAQEASSPLELVPDTASLGEDARLLSPDSLVIQRPGAAVRLLPVATDANGNALEPGAAVTWLSSDAAVATVDPTGLVTAVSVGAAVVTATSGNSAAASGSDGRTRAAAAAGGLFARTTGTINVLVSNTAADRAALVALYEATDGPNWVNSDGWLTDASMGEWYGVTTDVAGRVVGLDLTGDPSSGTLHGLRGSLPAELGNLASLTRLDLSINGLSGPIPAELGNLGSLTYLRLSLNGLTGSIPAELGNLTNLTRLHLSRNGRGLTGPIPPELGNLANLTELNLSLNGLTGPIPVELGNLASLTHLILSLNGLTGSIPAELGNLSGLKILGLGANGLTGPIPVELGNLNTVESLNLRDNALTGPIPAALGDLSTLRILALDRNALAGPIPPELGNLSNMVRLELAANDLTGPVPEELGNLSSLQNLSLNDNALTGLLPESFLQIDGLSWFHVGGNASLCVPNTGRLPRVAPTNRAAGRGIESVRCRGHPAHERPRTGRKPRLVTRRHPNRFSVSPPRLLLWGLRHERRRDRCHELDER